MSPTAIAQSKACTGCKEHKSLDKFGKDKRKKDGRQSRCHSCENARKADYDPAQRKLDVIKHKYKLDQTTYEEMVEATPHCPICGSEEPLVIDHDHSTGEVRGLICQPCNKGLGFFRDNIESMKNAITYLQ